MTAEPVCRRWPKTHLAARLTEAVETEAPAEEKVVAPVEEEAPVEEPAATEGAAAPVEGGLHEADPDTLLRLIEGGEWARVSSRARLRLMHQPNSNWRIALHYAMKHGMPVGHFELLVAAHPAGVHSLLLPMGAAA